MARAYSTEGLGSSEQILSFADQRISELEEEIEDAKNELKMWKSIRKELQPCEECGGKGRVIVDFTDHSSPQMGPCPVCKGKRFRSNRRRKVA